MIAVIDKIQELVTFVGKQRKEEYKRQKDYAIFLPAISGFFATFMINKDVRNM